MHEVQLYASIIALEIMIDGRQLRRVNEPRKQMSPLVTKAKPQRGVLLGIAPFVLVVFFVYLMVGIPLAAIPLQVHDVLRFDNLTVGIAIGTQSLATVMTRQFAGTLCDHRGAKFAMLLGGGGSILAGAVYLLATLPAPNPSASLALLLAARLISGLAESLARWSPILVGVSVRNSRSAKKEMTANIAIVALRPSRNAAANTPTIHHQARTRAMRLSTTAAAFSSLTRARRMRPTSEATISSATTPPISQ
jgi:MFS family permease